MEFIISLSLPFHGSSSVVRKFFFLFFPLAAGVHVRRAVVLWMVRWVGGSRIVGR